MQPSQEPNLAVFIDFDNVALGARDARQRFEIRYVLQRLLEKGKIIVKRAYADWRHHKEYLQDLHQAGIELIEIPAPQLSGKNSADIRLVVDAMDMCYGKEHMQAFVIVSGDSDFTPLVSKLRENGKSVIGVGMRNSSSRLLIMNCDEFIFYDDLYNEQIARPVEGLQGLPKNERDLFEFLVATIQGLMRESRGVLYSSLIKDTMKRKQPEFSEHEFGYSNFGDLLEDAMGRGLLVVERDSRAGGTWVVTALGKGVRAGTARPPAEPSAEAAAEGGAPRRSRGRRRGRRRGENGAREGAAPPAAEAVPPAPPAGPATEAAPAATADEPAASARRRRPSSRRRAPAEPAAPAAPAGPAEPPPPPAAKPRRRKPAKAEEPASPVETAASAPAPKRPRRRAAPAAEEAPAPAAPARRRRR